MRYAQRARLGMCAVLQHSRSSSAGQVQSAATFGASRGVGERGISTLAGSLRCNLSTCCWKLKRRKRNKWVVCTGLLGGG